MKNEGSAARVSTDRARSKFQRPAQLDPERQRIVLEHRARALRTSYHFLKRWHIGIEREEIISLTDSALCEAALGFKPDVEAEFSTYLFYFLKGALIRLVTRRLKERNGTRSFSRESADFDEQPMQQTMDRLEAEAFDQERSSASPHRRLLLAEMRQRCGEALKQLSEVEREVVIEVHLYEEKLAAVARRLGYSRGHLSFIRRQAFEKVRPMLEPFKQAV